MLMVHSSPSASVPRCPVHMRRRRTTWATTVRAAVAAHVRSCRLPLEVGLGLSGIPDILSRTADVLACFGLGAFGLALGFQPLVVGHVADCFLGLALELFGLVLKILSSHLDSF